LPFPSPKGLQQLLAKASPIVSQPFWQRIPRHGFANSLFWLLAKPLDKDVGKGTLLEKLACFAGKKPSFANIFVPCCWQSWEIIFFPFLLLFSYL
jgi:hypothetical protein